jgi:predicted metal-binding protein
MPADTLTENESARYRFLIMTIQHTIFVCQTCAGVWQDGKQVGKSGGQQLLEQLTELYERWALAPEFSIESVECMSACSRSCVVAFTAPGKHTYLFGDLNSDAEALPTTSAAVLECASLYLTKTDGIMPWSERPKLLKQRILARIPSSI